MKTLPSSEQTLIIRTDFTNDVVWQRVLESTKEIDPLLKQGIELMAALNDFDAEEAFQNPANLLPIDDRAYEGISHEELINLIPPDGYYSVMFVVDSVTIEATDHPVLVVRTADEDEDFGNTFRTVPGQVPTIENNLSTANCDWRDFANSVSKNGVFQGY